MVSLFAGLVILGGVGIWLKFKAGLHDKSVFRVNTTSQHSTSVIHSYSTKKIFEFEFIC